MKQLTLIFLLTAISINLMGQEPEITGQEKEGKIITKFFELFKKDSEQALDYLYGLNKWIDNEGEGVIQLKSQIKDFETQVGAYYGEEFIHKHKLGKDLSAYVYLVKYDRQPLRFTFKFYRPKDKWMIYSFKFEDSFETDLDEVMKYDYLRSNY